MATDEHDAAEPGSFAVPIVEGPDGPMARVNTYDNADAANEAARQLVENGIGASVVDAGWAMELHVVPHEGRRAAEVLGLVEADPTIVPISPVGEKPAKPKLELKQVLLLWLVAFITLPLVAGLVSYWLVSRR